MAEWMFTYDSLNTFHKKQKQQPLEYLSIRKICESVPGAPDGVLSQINNKTMTIGHYHHHLLNVPKVVIVVEWAEKLTLLLFNFVMTSLP